MLMPPLPAAFAMPLMMLRRCRFRLIYDDDTPRLRCAFAPRHAADFAALPADAPLLRGSAADAADAAASAAAASRLREAMMLLMPLRADAAAAFLMMMISLSLMLCCLMLMMPAVVRL